ncbi:C40 family peptidase [Promicromonospora sp. NPDC023987]|uniref:C40 family peptidase n=1 Tax=Promicromonospora sp. NPDC023987 TaxID=3155360 RepID=UPI00340AC25B
MEPSFSPTTTTTGRGRHRAVRRPVLASVARATTEHVTAFAGRTAVVAAAGSGVLLSLVATPAQAAPATTSVNTSLAGKPAQATLNATDLNALTTQARQAVAEASVVTVAPDAQLKVETAVVSVVSAQENEEYQEQVTAEEAAKVGSAVVSIGMRYLGVPYVWGGSTPAGFDCSGFTSYVYAQVGIILPRTSSEQRYAGSEVSWSEAQPGDLIWSPGHIAIYAGDGMQIEAPVPGQSVRYTSIWQSNPTFLRVG